MRDNIPCREASAVKLAPDHTSKLDAVLVDPCFLYSVCWREGKRKEERREEKERRNEEKERREKKGGGRERSKEEARTERKR